MKEINKPFICAKRFEYRVRMECREYRKGKKYLKLLDKLKIGKIIAYDDSCWDDEKYKSLLLYYLEYIKFNKVKRIKDIDNNSYFYNEGFYFKYNNKIFKFVRVWGQGSYSYVERIS